MARVSIGQPTATYEVDLWGTIYTAKPATRSVAKKGQALIERIEKATETDEAAAVYGDALDLRLEPANGKRVKASTIVKRKWEADEVTLDQLAGLLEGIAEADRPT